MAIEPRTPLDVDATIVGRVIELPFATHAEACAQLRQLRHLLDEIPRLHERVQEVGAAAKRERARANELQAALAAIAQMDPEGLRADDLGQAARIAADAIRSMGGVA